MGKPTGEHAPFVRLIFDISPLSGIGLRVTFLIPFAIELVNYQTTDGQASPSKIQDTSFLLFLSPLLVSLLLYFRLVLPLLSTLLYSFPGYFFECVEDGPLNAVGRCRRGRGWSKKVCRFMAQGPTPSPDAWVIMKCTRNDLLLRCPHENLLCKRRPNHRV